MRSTIWDDGAKIVTMELTKQVAEGTFPPPGGA